MGEFGELAKEALAPPKAPDSLVARYGLLAGKGISNLPEGMLNALAEKYKHPLETAGMIGGAAAIGALVKIVLPKMGTPGKVAAIAAGSYVTYKAAEPVFDAFHIAGQATSMNDLDVAGKILGDASGAFLVNSAIAGAAYKLGGMGAEKYLIGKGKFAAPPPVPGDSGPIAQPRWTSVIASNFPGTLSIVGSSSAQMNFDGRLVGVQKFTASELVNSPLGDLKGPLDENTQLDVTVQLKSKASDQEMEQMLKEIALGKRPKLSDEEFAEKFGAPKESLEQLKKFAEVYDLKVKEADLRSGRVVLSGTAKCFSEAFKTKISEYEQNGVSTRERSGALFVPKAVAKNIEGVFGIENRPQVNPRISEVKPLVESNSADDKAYRPDEIADAYNFPKGTTGKGQAVAILQFGGGINLENEASYYKHHGLKVPDIRVLEISGAKSAVGKHLPADREASLDSQVIGTVAPDAKQTLIYAPNSEQGFVDAIGRAAFPKENELENQAISISWGQSIEQWTEQGKRNMQLAFKKASLKGISIFAASGDDGAPNGNKAGKLHVDYPAADPYVTGVGGTRLFIKDGLRDQEVTWNDRFGATGGGISPHAVPDYQNDLPKVTMKELKGRGVPDISAHASSFGGYKIRVRGQDEVAGGTSAASPLFAALSLRLNEGLGGKKTVGFMNPFLYQQAMSGKGDFFNDITSGDNKGYEAGKGWDPVTGWGSINGEKLLEAYKKTLPTS